MAIFQTTVAANTTATLIGKAVKPANADFWEGSVGVSGTFGSGTVTFLVSYDGGTTKFAIAKDAYAATLSFTAAGMTQLPHLGNGNNNNDAPLIYVVLSGATNPSLTITLADNR